MVQRQRHAALAGKLIDSKAESRRLTVCMMQVEAVMKMLAPGFNLQTIAVRRRKPNPWFKRGTVYRAALDVLRGAPGPMTARDRRGHAGSQGHYRGARAGGQQPGPRRHVVLPEPQG